MFIPYLAVSDGSYRVYCSHMLKQHDGAVVSVAPQNKMVSTNLRKCSTEIFLFKKISTKFSCLFLDFFSMTSGQRFSVFTILTKSQCSNVWAHPLQHLCSSFCWVGIWFLSICRTTSLINVKKSGHPFHTGPGLSRVSELQVQQLRETWEVKQKVNVTAISTHT